ncbi:hypothetical protein GCM10027020_06150 [Nocardioides salsibiostraticola]
MSGPFTTIWSGLRSAIESIGDSRSTKRQMTLVVPVPGRLMIGASLGGGIGGDPEGARHKITSCWM